MGIISTLRNVFVLPLELTVLSGVWIYEVQK
jgi:hypothetical protein